MGNENTKVQLEADCPFCGHDQVFIKEELDDEGDDYVYQAECSNCGARGPQAFESKNNALRSWNKRVSGWIKKVNP